MTVRFERPDGSEAFINPEVTGIVGVADSGVNRGFSIIKFAGDGKGWLVKGSAREVMVKLGLSLGDNAPPDFPDDPPYDPEPADAPPRAITHSSGEE